MLEPPGEPADRPQAVREGLRGDYRRKVAAPARSLADDLRARDDAALAALLLRRPDLARPAPADITTLAARATTRASVQRALDGLDLAHLQALEAICVVAPGTPAEVARLLDQPARSSTVATLVSDLCELALAWRSPDGVRVPRTVQEVVGDPAGLGPPNEDVPTGTALTAELAALDLHEQALAGCADVGPGGRGPRLGDDLRPQAAGCRRGRG